MIKIYEYGKLDKKEIDKRVRQMLVLVNLKGFEKRYLIGIFQISSYRNTVSNS